MSKKKDRAWFVCREWPALVARHYESDSDAARALDVDPRLLAKSRAGTPLAKSSLLKLLRRYASRHELGSPVADLVLDTRSR
ncbi:MAG: hypothetical protein ABSA58_08600 [Acetobacteraceae bacterium]|jgi:hypothetical protein